MKTMKTLLILAVVFFIATSTAWGAPRKVTLDQYLTAADIQRVSGLAGVKAIAKNPNIGAGGDLNFTTSDNKMILMVQVVGQSQYAGYKQMFFKSAVKGLGDEAMEGATMPGYPNNIVVFTKGFTCVAVTIFGNPAKPGQNMLTVAQTIELAKDHRGQDVDFPWYKIGCEG